MTENPRNGQNINVLVITKHFTRYTQAIITTSQTAWVMAWALWDGFFTHYGFPASILSDQGKNFESNLIKNYMTWVASTKFIPPLTTHRGMGNSNGSIPF